MCLQITNPQLSVDNSSTRRNCEAAIPGALLANLSQEGAVRGTNNRHAFEACVRDVELVTLSSDTTRCVEGNRGTDRLDKGAIFVETLDAVVVSI